MTRLHTLQRCGPCNNLSSPGASHPISLGAIWACWDKQTAVLVGPPWLLQHEQPPTLASNPPPPPPPQYVLSHGWMKVGTSNPLLQLLPTNCERDEALPYNPQSNPQVKCHLSPISHGKTHISPNLPLATSETEQQMGLQKSSHLKKNLKTSLLHSEKQFILHHFKK